MEQDFLARFTGDGGGQRLQGHLPLPPPPSPTRGLHVRSEEEQWDRADDHDHGRAPPGAPAAADVVASPCPPAPRVQFASPPASVVVAGRPVLPLRRRPTALPAGAGSWPRAHGSLSGGLPSTAGLRPIGTTAATRQEQCCRDACGLCAQLLRGLAADLDRARAQVALLTCENESLRHRLNKRAAAAGTETETAPAAAAPSLERVHAAGGLRCRACRDRPATVLLAPREHLCLCGPCSSACRYDPAVACWVCRAAVRTGHPAAAPR